MDNQQITSAISDNYFGGLIDSGFRIQVQEFHPGGKLQLRPTISFVNTDFTFIESVSLFLKDNGINHHVSFREATVKRDKKQITIQRLKKCIDFAEKWSSFSIVRRPQLELLKEFCYDRLRYVRSKGFKHSNTPYTEQQKELSKQIRFLNYDYNYDSGFRNLTWAWLGGFLDASGIIHFIESNNRVVPAIDFTTESETALNNIKEFFRRQSIEHTVRSSRSRTKREVRKGKPYKTSYTISIQSFSSLEIFLQGLINRLVGKALQRDLMLEYLELGTTAEFSKQIINKVNSLNSRRYPRDYTRGSL